MMSLDVVSLVSKVLPDEAPQVSSLLREDESLDGWTNIQPDEICKHIEICLHLCSLRIKTTPYMRHEKNYVGWGCVLNHIMLSYVCILLLPLWYPYIPIITCTYLLYWCFQVSNHSDVHPLQKACPTMHAPKHQDHSVTSCSLRIHLAIYWSFGELLSKMDSVSESLAKQQKQFSWCRELQADSASDNCKLAGTPHQLIMLHNQQAVALLQTRRPD